MEEESLTNVVASAFGFEITLTGQGAIFRLAEKREMIAVRRLDHGR